MVVASNDVSKLFLQAILSRRVVSAELAKALKKKCVETVQAANSSLDLRHSDSADSWDSFVASINRNLNSMNIEFRRTTDEITGKEMYTMVNQKDDGLAQVATEYTVAEVALFKAVVEQIMLAPRDAYSCPSLLALREAATVKPNMTKAHAEVVLASFVTRGWLVKSRRGRYSLSARSLLELQQYLKDTYPDESIDCDNCKELITRGVSCPRSDCTVRMHRHCLARFYAVHRNGAQCSACGTSWGTDDARAAFRPIGEEAARDGDGIGARARRKRVEQRAESEEAQSEEAEGEGEEAEASQPRRNGGKGKEPRVRREQQEDEDDGDDDLYTQDSQPSQPTHTQNRRSSRRG